MKRIAEALNELYNDQSFHILISERYQFNELIKVATEQEFREGLLNEEELLCSTVDLFSIFNHFKLNKDLCRELETKLTRKQKENVDWMVLGQYNNSIDTPYQPLFYNNCAMWIESTKMKKESFIEWKLNVQKEDLIQYFRVHAILLERNRI